MRKYLLHYAEPEVSLADGINSKFGHALVVPAYGESAFIESMLDSVPNGPLGSILVILVVNAPQNAPDNMLQDNRDLMSRLKQDVLVIDRTTTPELRLPPKQGVGLARKIGCDLALALFAQGKIVSPWIHSTDADVLLPSDYFAISPFASPLGDSKGGRGIFGPTPSAQIYPFTHIDGPDPQVNKTTKLYEQRLHSYVDGLRSAGSPYAFHSIGSTIAVHAKSYAAVRGFPKLAAGEDFYLLNKLAKVGTISERQGEPIQIRARLSTRVPFGTGQACEKAISENRPIKIYDPELFVPLKKWLDYLNLVADQGCLDEIPVIKKIASQYPAGSSRLRALHTWFDGFRTMRCINSMVPRGGIEPPTRGFSVLCSTD